MNVCGFILHLVFWLTVRSISWTSQAWTPASSTAHILALHKAFSFSNPRKCIGIPYLCQTYPQETFIPGRTDLSSPISESSQTFLQLTSTSCVITFQCWLFWKRKRKFFLSLTPASSSVLPLTLPYKLGNSCCSFLYLSLLLQDVWIHLLICHKWHLSKDDLVVVHISTCHASVAHQGSTAFVS